MKKHGLTQLSILIAVLIITTVGVITALTIEDFGSCYTENRVDDVRDTVVSYVSQCYALEGAYPADLQYLEANYGLQLDSDKYIYHYEMFATNIFPDVQVFAKQRDGD